MIQKILVLIPARYDSSRFPGKPLARLLEKSLIQTVYENCQVRKAHVSLETVVVTDSQQIEDHLQQNNCRVVRVDDEVESGTERIHLAFQRFFTADDYDFIINLQGDEPLFDTDLLLKFVEFTLREDQFDIYTMVKKQTDLEEFKNPNVVKACVENNRCLYFSRMAIPYCAKEWYQHIGIYGFRVKALQKFCSYPPSRLERVERLEQLRALANGLNIAAMETDRVLMGVDTKEDLEKVEKYLKGKIS